MYRFFTERGNYKVACYDVDVDQSMRHDALSFAKEIILTKNQYSRLLPNKIKNTNDIDMKINTEIQRTYVGKLGEIAFKKFLEEKGKIVPSDEMFAVYEGESNVDSFDFITKSGKTVDVKTGFRHIHTRLLVNTDQFDNIPKNYYVGIKLNAEDIDSENKLVDWDKISIATIFGYSDYEYMKKYAPIKDFGEGPARCVSYNKLLGIDKLLNDF